MEQPHPMIEWNDAPKAGRRGWRFSLKGLLIVVAILSLPGWYLASERAAVRERREMREWIRARYGMREWGGHCGNEVLPQLTPLRAWLGDEIAFRFHLLGVPREDRLRIAALFPEARITPDLPAKNDEPMVIDDPNLRAGLW